MTIPMARHAAFSSIRAFTTWGLLSLCAIAGQAAAALSVSPSTVALSAGTYVTARITGANGSIQAQSRDSAVATVTLSNVTR